MQQSVGGQEGLGTLDFALGNAGAKPHQLLGDVVNHVFDLKRIRHEVQAPQSGVLVASVETLIRVAEVTFAAGTCQIGGVLLGGGLAPVPGAQQGGGDHEGQGVGVGPAGTFDGDGDVG